MYKIITAVIAFVLGVNAAFADGITKTLRSLDINPSAVSISVKDVQSGGKVYALNPKTPMNPASTLKVLTSSASVSTLGKDFEFETALYKSTNNDLYLKLVGDPFLKTSDLEKLINTAVEKKIIQPKKLYIDDTAFDGVEWGEGWQWDDDLNPYMPKFSAYNLDGNLVNIEITPVVQNTPPAIFTKPFYPVTVMNLVNTDLKSGNNILKVERDTTIAPNIIKISGDISKTAIVKIPSSSPKLYFSLRLDSIIKKLKMDYYGGFISAKLPKNNIYNVDKVTHNLDEVMGSVLKDSNNMSAESLFKLAGSIWANEQGSIANSVSMMREYFDKLGLNYQDIKIVDGSGVSKNNLLTADFMTDFLVKIAATDDYDYLKQHLASPGEGTMKNRMLYFKDNLKAKTGTLSDTSAIAGYITTRKGKTYAFDIMIRDAKTSETDKKNIEEQILRQIFMN